MNINIQILSLCIYYIYGITLYIIMLIINRKKTLLILPISFIMFFITNYHINKIVVHPYFIIFLLLGFISSKIYVKSLKRFYSLLKHKKVR